MGLVVANVRRNAPARHDARFTLLGFVAWSAAAEAAGAGVDLVTQVRGLIREHFAA
jgi:hypothetical protein